MSKTLTKFISTGKSDSHYTMYFHEYSRADLIKFFSDKLDKINKTMKDKYKKNMANDILYRVKSDIESTNFAEPFSYFILANTEDQHFIPFSKEDKELFNDWNLSVNMFDFGDRFKINYLTKLFTTKLNLLVYHFNNKEVTIKNIDHFKTKINEKVNVDRFEDVMNDYSSKYPIYCGVSSYLNKVKPKYLIKGKTVTNNIIIEYYENLIEKENIDRLNREILGNINNEKVNHKFLFGKKEISKGITDMTIKTLYINKKLYNVLRKRLIESDSIGLINFEVVIIIDVKILGNYDGMIAEKYY